MTSLARTTTARTADWRAANDAYLELHVARLRLRLERRILWLRTRWREDPLQEHAAEVISDVRAERHLEPDDPNAEAQFHRFDPRSRGLADRLAALDEALSVQSAGRMDPALEALAELFHLAPFERDVLILGVAPEIDPGLDLLYAYVQDDPTRRYATPALALSLVDDVDQRSRARAVFAQHAPLRAFRLIQLAGDSSTLSSQRLRMDERVVHYLLGVGNRPDAVLARLLTPIDELPLGSAQTALAERLARLVAGDEVTAVNLVGLPGSGRHAVAARLARQLGLSLVQLNPSAAPTAEVERYEWMAAIEREAILLNLAFYVDAEALDTQDRGRLAAAREVVESLRALVVIGSRERYDTSRRLIAAEAPRLDAAARRALWQDMAGVGGAGIDTLVQQFEIGPHAIAQAVRAARDRSRLDGHDGGRDIGPADLWRACRERAAQPLQDLGRRIDASFGWDDLILPDDSAAQLREIAAQVAQRSRVYEDWGFGVRLARGRGISALFAGPSGTGKTMAAEVLARDLDLDLFRIDLAGMVSKYIGETEKNLRRVFDAAEASGAILFFDEADALFGKRSEVKDSHDRYANIEIDYLLQRMEDYRGLAILATNMRSTLDPAFLRRLRFIVDIPFPDAAIRRRIWQGAFPAAVPTEGLDLDALSRLDVAGGSIKNIALNAAFTAAFGNTPVRMEHVLHAARREYQKLEKMLPSESFGRQATGGRA